MARLVQFALVFTLLIAALAATAGAEEVTTRDFFEHSKIRNIKLSPDGEHAAFTYEEGTQVKLAVMNLEDQEVTAAFGLGKNQHVLNFWWASNSRVVKAVGEVTGNLDNTGRAAHLYAADVDGGNRKQIFETRRSSFRVLDPLHDDPDHILIAKYHFTDEGQPKAHKLHVDRGETRYLADQPDDEDIAALLPDNSGELRVAIAFESGETIDDRKITLYLKQGEEWRELDVAAERQPVDMNMLGFSGDNRQAYFLSNHDMAENDRLGVFRYDFDTEKLELLYRHPEVDISGAIYGSDGGVLGVVTRFGPRDYTFFDDIAQENEEAILLQRLVASFPGQDVSITSFSNDGDLASVWVRGDRNPGEFYLFDTESMEARFLAAARPDLPKEVLVPMEPVRIEARDGLELHAMLTRPEGREEDLPLIVNVHGGPFGITDHWGFHSEAQYFAHHGYATLQVNYRGSGNRGTDFTNKGRQEWGGKMQDDVTDATRWAIEQGIADPERICIYGGSYGGYATLMGVIKTPDLFECGVGYVGVYDLPWFREGDGNDWSRQQGREARQGRERWMNAFVGEDPEALKEVSPVHNVEKIEADLFLVHGGSDVRVVVGHFERLKEALDEIGKDYRSMLKEDEGHGFYDVDNRVDLYEAMHEFLDKHIGPERSTDA
ncbi:MAG: prolyl oligopeptidase family serine peptidase [Gammaproteobacteria bacterium]|jgi:dipeptidyl aminopeptidase/acylaminoacyl peptidase|nr:prolyl oligopeptidase family serine peptidase [Gammaproteobacteria bacterium]